MALVSQALLVGLGQKPEPEMADCKLFLGRIVHCSDKFALEVFDEGFLLVREKKILDIGNFTDLNSALRKHNISNYNEIKLTKSQLLIPGLIDAHIHAPQYPNAGLGYDKPLLNWLDSYTYKLEKQYKDDNLSDRVYNAIVRKTLDYGTTTACYFASMYESSSLILAKTVEKMGQRALIGKINMTNLAPQDYIETEEETIANTISFIKNISKMDNELIEPIITPRFALSLEIETMRKLGQIAQEHSLRIQSHISENRSEVDLVRSTFNSGYAQVYNNCNLLTDKTVMAHGVYLTDEEAKLLATKGTSVAHCPDSNLCLRSGLCNVRHLLESGVNVGLGTDVSGGPSPSIIQAMRSAINTSIELSFRDPKNLPLTYEDVFYLATLGGAKSLSLDHKIGNFEAGKDFDALLIDAKVENSAIDYLCDCDCLELLQKFVFVGDDRNVREVYVAGRKVK